MFKMLIINPGSTSTKIAVFEDEKEILGEVLRHSSEEIGKYGSVIEQKDFRKDVILKVLEEKNVDVKTLNAVVGRGGLLKPVVSGTYEVNEAMIADLNDCINGEHASNLGGLIASEFAKELNIKAFIVDPVVVDELTEVARISGIPELPRRSIFHALNQKAVAKRYAKENGKRYEDLNLLVVHLGGGVSIGAHKGGKIIDVNNILDGEGSFSPERSGTVPAGDLVRMCFSGDYTKEEILKKITGKGGIVAYLDSNDTREVQAMVDKGDEKAKLVYDAMKYQICKDIGAFATVLSGKVDAIIVTGGIAYSQHMINYIKENTGWIAEVTVYPGEDEMLALAQGALRVLNKEEESKIYR